MDLYKGKPIENDGIKKVAEAMEIGELNFQKLQEMLLKHFS